MYARPIEQLIRAFTHLPSVGQRTAERFVFYLLKSGKKEVNDIMIALKQLMETVKSCDICWDFSDRSPCAICADKTRDKTLLCVVANSQEVQAVEKTGAYQGRYHLLRGTIAPDDATGLQWLKLNELKSRISEDKELEEVILAFNPDLSGESTMMFLEQTIHLLRPDMRVSRLARGLPMGGDLQYADDITLGSALTNRTKL